MNSIKIMLEDEQRYLVESLFIYNSLYRSRLSLARSYRRSAQHVVNKRKRALLDIANGIEHNATLLLEVVNSIKAQCSLDAVVEYGYFYSKFSSEANDMRSYLKDFLYLRRDWCGSDQGDYEIRTIVDSLIQGLGEHVDTSHSALFLGAGLGRIAWELTSVFEKVYALDKSYSMVYHFQKLLSSDIDFYEINESNIYNPLESAVLHRATIKNCFRSDGFMEDRFEYFVGDVLNLPFPDSSINCIASVYFTDVLALTLYIEQITRVLSSGGVYIHFGPLSYFFTDIKQKLSAEEVKDAFMGYGYEIVHDELIEVPFMPVSYGFMKTVQTNWFFIAKKSDIGNNIYRIAEGLEVQKTHSLFEEDGAEKCNLIVPTGREFENAVDVVRVLKYFREETPLDGILSMISSDFEMTKDDLASVKRLIFRLIKEKILLLSDE